MPQSVRVCKVYKRLRIRVSQQSREIGDVGLVGITRGVVLAVAAMQVDGPTERKLIGKASRNVIAGLAAALIGGNQFSKAVVHLYRAGIRYRRECSAIMPLRPAPQ